eukprot:gnl/TRDRNA2_/TRDRNA2_149563_c0_seq1.p1 gnl/TRDRNA2_/TRDRNA2_149563_c0~~gnl/TRDRNA2_/TRDRNA2_149563_c0_seq1.p1  ORF type:complete len:388 (+),score=75.90 gnl/TRDRNA2_/TRDRNA2_149563_c0_seq1:32-1195(+)
MVQLWLVVGGAETGGILVREGEATSSKRLEPRLSTGAKIEEIEVVGERLHFRKLLGTGPPEGWISIRLPGKDLAVRIDLSDVKEEAEKDAQVADAEQKDVAQEQGISAATSADAIQPLWVQRSAEKLKALREGAKVPPASRAKPSRLEGPSAIRREQLPPFIRLDHKKMAEMSIKNLPGHYSNMKFPHSSEQLMEFGAKWYTDAFHRFGTLPKDNAVKKVVSVEQLPHSGFDAAGGAGHKAFITVEYEKPDPELHTELFAKMPWDYFESDIGKQYRMQISTYGDMDSGEVNTYIWCEHLFPFKIPKLYFTDINRETTNYILITERVLFGKRGKVVRGKVVETIERQPFDMLPVCGKYQDFLLDDPAEIYRCLFQAMAHLAAWDQCGH